LRLVLGADRRADRGDTRPRLAGTVNLPTIEDAVKTGGFLAGRPEDIIEQLKAVEKRYPGSIASFLPPRSTSSSQTSTGLRRR
jgi:hypothetical protein